MAGLTDRLLEKGFGRPSGVLGRIGGRLMAHGNAATERHLVELAELGPDDVVVVLGPGPGVGLEAAARRARHVIGVDPSETMLRACARRCAPLVEQGGVRLVLGIAEDTGLPAAAASVVLSVNSVQLWTDRGAGLAEVHRVLRPGGRVLLSAHRRWLPGGADGLAAATGAAGFVDVRTWSWEPPGRGAGTAVQLRALRPEGAACPAAAAREEPPTR